MPGDINDWNIENIAMHFILGETKENVWLAEQMSFENKTVTVIDPRYIKRGRIENRVIYTSMELARGTFDIADSLYFHSYMDPMNRKPKKR